ncbi:hypothetical protein IMY05_013G0074400 [Salix suchowensis]|nr:hypothetical protein IMY05_013G0074400 [Salix suchowensis]
MIKCIPKSYLIKAFNFHHFRIQRINIKQLFNTIIFIHAVSLSMLPLLCTRGRCPFSLFYYP